MKWTLVLFASLLFVATAVKSEEKGLTGIEEVKDKLADEVLSSIEKVKDELPSEEDDDETDLVKKDNVEGVQRELNDNEEKISQSDTKSWARRRRTFWGRRRRRRRRRGRFWGRVGKKLLQRNYMF